MRYRQLDEIVELDPGNRIVAQRTLHAHEDYLADHFPRFPVMPGVMMLEALYQASMWMIRTGDDFEYPFMFLKEAKSVKFGDFLTPGETLTIKAEKLKEVDSLVTVKAQAMKGDKVTVSARLVIERGSSDSTVPHAEQKDADCKRLVRQQFHEMYGEQAAVTEALNA